MKGFSQAQTEDGFLGAAEHVGKVLVGRDQLAFLVQNHGGHGETIEERAHVRGLGNLPALPLDFFPTLPRRWSKFSRQKRWFQRLVPFGGRELELVVRSRNLQENSENEMGRAVTYITRWNCQLGSKMNAMTKISLPSARAVLF
jgi:hypothetical protein